MILTEKSINAEEPKILEVIEKFKETTARILESNLYCLYITGSFAGGYFDVNSSDIDFVCIIERALMEDEIAALQNEYREIRKNGWWSTRTESVFLTREYCSNPTPDSSCNYVLRTNGDFVLSQSRSDWIIQLHMAKKFGIFLGGHADINTLVPEISSSQL